MASSLQIGVFIRPLVAPAAPASWRAAHRRVGLVRNRLHCWFLLSRGWLAPPGREATRREDRQRPDDERHAHGFHGARPLAELQPGGHHADYRDGQRAQPGGARRECAPVSYTHLTLPTIYS